jgi:hypothetical protein
MKDRIKNHFDKNKKVYIAMGVCLVAGTILGAVAILKLNHGDASLMVGLKRGRVVWDARLQVFN